MSERSPGVKNLRVAKSVATLHQLLHNLCGGFLFTKTKPPKAVLFSFYPIISDEVLKRMHMQGAQGSCCEPYFLYGELQLAAVATQQMRAFWKLCLVGF